MHQTAILLNAITALTHRSLYLAGHKAISRLKRAQFLKIKAETHDHIKSWNSVYSGISVITNRITTRHRDDGGSSAWYDLLLSSGTHRKAFFRLDDIGAWLSYNPGTVVMVCGKVLSHSLPKWSGGERICLVHWMRSEVHHRLGVYSPEWSVQGCYTRLMNKTFTAEQKWTEKSDDLDLLV
jgi:hypothetical protein